MKKQLFFLSCMVLTFLFTGCEKDDTQEFTITVTNDGNGIATSSVAKAVRGTTITLTANPNSDYSFSKWMVESGDVTLSTPTISPATFTMPATNVEIRAIFGKADILPMITDPVFKAYAEYRMDNTEIDKRNKYDDILPVWDTNGDGKLSEAEAAAVTYVNLGEDFDGGAVKSMDGIEYFTGLLVLDCGSNELTSLDISNNTALIYLNCSNNELTSLDVSKNTALTLLGCDYNQLTALNVSKNTSLDLLNIGFNPITSIDVSENVVLTRMFCQFTQLTSLDVSKNPGLIHLECHNSQLLSLDVSKNPELVYLFCSNNQLTTLNTGKIAKLVSIYCENNKLSSLDVSGNTGLGGFDCYNNQLTSLIVGESTSLTVINCYKNKLAQLDISGCTKLEKLYCFENANPFKIKVWSSFNIESPNTNAVEIYWDSNIQFVYQF